MPMRMPMWRGTRPLKRWRYVGVFCDEVMVCVADARIGPLRQRFWAVAEPDRPITAATTLARGGGRIGGSRVPVDPGDVGFHLAIEEDGGVEPRHDDDVWTRKQA